MKDKKLICIIDGSAAFRHTLAEIVHRHFFYYDVRFYDTESAFLDELTTQNLLPDLILVDRNQAQENGYILDQYISKPATLRVLPIVSLVNSLDELSAESRSSDAETWILKERDPARLRDAFSRICFYWLESMPAPK